MGNHQSSDKDTVLQNLWKAQRAIPVVPLNPKLDALRVLTKHSNGYHDVGNVISLSKSAGQHEFLSPRKQKRFVTTKSMGTQSYTIADNHGAVATKLTDASAWFQNATSVQVRIPECWVREYDVQNWNDMVRHFNPDMHKVNSKLQNPDVWNSQRELFIVQKVVLVSHITITAKYTTSAACPEVQSAVSLPSGLQIKRRILDEGTTVEFTISGTQENQKLPIAFSGFKYTYDKFGELKSQPRTQADSASASSSHVEDEDDEDEEEDEDDEEDVAADDADMGDFLDDEGWCTQIVSDYDPSEYEIFDKCDEGDEPPPPPGTPAGSPPGSPRSPRNDLEDID